MTVRIHPTAIVAESARIGIDVTIGPYAIVGDGVSLGEGTRLLGPCVIHGPTTIGARNVVHPYAVLGSDPQDRSYAGEPTELTIGDDNVFREHVTVHRGTKKDRGETRIGSGCLLMAAAHVAHDAVLGDNVTLTNGALLGGHVAIGNHVVIGGGAALAPFVRVGESAFVAGGSMVEIDVPPFVIAEGNRARVRSLNEVGLRRRGIPQESRRLLARAFRVLFRSGMPRVQALEVVRRELSSDGYVAKLVAFLDRG